MNPIIRNCYSRLLSRRIVKKICAVCLAAAAICTMCACKAEVSSLPKQPNREIRIGVSVYDEYASYASAMSRKMTEWSKEKEKSTGSKVYVDIVSAQGSQLRQNDQAEKFIAKGYDVLCINLVDRTDSTVIIDKAMDADIPVIFFNRELVEEDLCRWDKLYYVGGIAEDSGKLQAQIIISDLSDKDKFDEIDVNHNGTIQYVMLEGEAGHQDALVRTQVSIDTLKKAGFNLEKLGDEIANWDRAQAKTKMTSLIEHFPFQIEMVIANNDDMALGAIDALESAGYPLTPYVVGVDGTEDALEAIRTRKLNGSVYNNLNSQAEVIMNMAYSLATEGILPEDTDLTDDKYVYLPYEKITYDNVQKYIHANNK